MSGKTLVRLLTVILSAVLIYSAVRIVITEAEYKKADEIYDYSRSEYFHVSSTPTPQVQQAEASPSPSEGGGTSVYLSYDELKAANPDIVGWIWIPETSVSYPLLRAEDNQKYLKLGYNLRQTSSGSIFMDYRNSPDFSDLNTVIYGHNMKNGSMFGGLKKYSDSGYMEQHQYLYIVTGDSTLTYRIFAAYKTDSESQSYTLSFPDDESYGTYIEYIISCYGSHSENEPAAPTPLITLSTCTSVQKSERFVVHAVLISAEESESSAVP